MPDKRAPWPTLATLYSSSFAAMSDVGLHLVAHQDHRMAHPHVRSSSASASSSPRQNIDISPLDYTARMRSLVSKRRHWEELIRHSEDDYINNGGLVSLYMSNRVSSSASRNPSNSTTPTQNILGDDPNKECLERARDQWKLAELRRQEVVAEINALEEAYSASTLLNNTNTPSKRPSNTSSASSRSASRLTTPKSVSPMSPPKPRSRPSIRASAFHTSTKHTPTFLLPSLHQPQFNTRRKMYRPYKAGVRVDWNESQELDEQNTMNHPNSIENKEIEEEQEQEDYQNQVQRLPSPSPMRPSNRHLLSSKQEQQNYSSIYGDNNDLDINYRNSDNSLRSPKASQYHTNEDAEMHTAYDELSDSEQHNNHTTTHIPLLPHSPIAHTSSQRRIKLISVDIPRTPAQRSTTLMTYLPLVDETLELYPRQDNYDGDTEQQVNFDGEINNQSHKDYVTSLRHKSQNSTKSTVQPPIRQRLRNSNSLSSPTHVTTSVSAVFSPNTAESITSVMESPTRTDKMNRHHNEKNPKRKRHRVDDSDSNYAQSHYSPPLSASTLKSITSSNTITRPTTHHSKSNSSSDTEQQTSIPGLPASPTQYNADTIPPSRPPRRRRCIWRSQDENALFRAMQDCLLNGRIKWSLIEYRYGKRGVVDHRLGNWDQTSYRVKARNLRIKKERTGITGAQLGILQYAEQTSGDTYDHHHNQHYHTHHEQQRQSHEQEGRDTSVVSD